MPSARRARSNDRRERALSDRTIGARRRHFQSSGNGHGAERAEQGRRSAVGLIDLQRDRSPAVCARAHDVCEKCVSETAPPPLGNDADHPQSSWSAVSAPHSTETRVATRGIAGDSVEVWIEMRPRALLDKVAKVPPPAICPRHVLA